MYPNHIVTIKIHKAILFLLKGYQMMRLKLPWGVAITLVVLGKFRLKFYLTRKSVRVISTGTAVEPSGVMTGP